MQTFLNGIISGASVALLAVAFQVVYLPTRVFFIGLAGIYSCAPFLAYAVITHGGGWFLAAGLSVLVSVGLSILCEWGSHGRLAKRQASDTTHLVASLGTYIVLVQFVAIIWGNDNKTLRSSSDVVTRWSGLVITGAQWANLLVAVVLLGGFGLFLMRSSFGLRLRALAENPVQFALFGYNVNHHRLLAFGLAGLFGAASALVAAYDVGFDPYAGLHAVLLAVVAVMIGGQGSFLGSILGAALLGLLRAQVVWYWSARWQEAVTFGLLALVLLLRPQGLLGQKSRLEATS